MLLNILRYFISFLSDSSYIAIDCCLLWCLSFHFWLLSSSLLCCLPFSLSLSLSLALLCFQVDRSLPSPSFGRKVRHSVLVNREIVLSIIIVFIVFIFLFPFPSSLILCSIYDGLIEKNIGKSVMCFCPLVCVCVLTANESFDFRVWSTKG